MRFSLGKGAGQCPLWWHLHAGVWRGCALRCRPPASTPCWNRALFFRDKGIHGPGAFPFPLPRLGLSPHLASELPSECWVAPAERCRAVGFSVRGQQGQAWFAWAAGVCFSLQTCSFLPSTESGRRRAISSGDIWERSGRPAQAGREGTERFSLSASARLTHSAVRCFG